MRSDYIIFEAESPESALDKLSLPPDVILLDLSFTEESTDQTGLEFLKILNKKHPDIPVVMATGFSDVAIAVEAMQIGASDFVPKSNLKISELKTRLKRALDTNRLKQKVEELEKELELVEPRRIIGESSEIKDIRRIIKAIADNGEISVLIRGETGTGKELVARAIHASGWRKSAPFVSVMLNALPETTLESELFGHEAGAFTDAKGKRIGYLEKAKGGVLFLDEIGEINQEIQVKLLRFLEEREFQRLGNTESIKLDVQVVTATNADLEEKVRTGTFREDLYFRLKVHEILLPPLRSRKEDIPLIIDHFLKVFKQQGKHIYEFSKEAIEELKSYSFLGNVRQLRNIVESALFNAEIKNHQKVESDDLPSEFHFDNGRNKTPEETVSLSDKPIQEILAQTELKYIQKALDKTQWRKSEAWKLLGYNDRFALTRRIKGIFNKFENLKDEYPEIYENFRN